MPAKTITDLDKKLTVLLRATYVGCTFLSSIVGQLTMANVKNGYTGRAMFDLSKEMSMKIMLRLAKDMEAVGVDAPDGSSPAPENN